jgi:metal-responsive CopG/Arc/MetJ family transcriptional regulator
MLQLRDITLSLPVDLLEQLETFIQSQPQQSLDEFVSLALRDRLQEIILKDSSEQDLINLARQVMTEYDEALRELAK